MKRKDGERLPTEGVTPLSHNPFAQLQEKRAALPSITPPPVKPTPPPPQGPARAVVRMERKGRGGKEVTVVEQLGLKPRDLETWLKALKGSLGCGGTIEDGALILQGDHRDRVKLLLEQRGVRRVTLG